MCGCLLPAVRFHCRIEALLSPKMLLCMAYSASLECSETLTFPNQLAILFSVQLQWKQALFPKHPFSLCWFCEYLHLYRGQVPVKFYKPSEKLCCFHLLSTGLLVQATHPLLEVGVLVTKVAEHAIFMLLLLHPMPSCLPLRIVLLIGFVPTRFLCMTLTSLCW